MMVTVVVRRDHNYLMVGRWAFLRQSNSKYLPLQKSETPRLTNLRRIDMPSQRAPTPLEKDTWLFSLFTRREGASQTWICPITSLRTHQGGEKTFATGALPIARGAHTRSTGATNDIVSSPVDECPSKIRICSGSPRLVGHSFAREHIVEGLYGFHERIFIYCRQGKNANLGVGGQSYGACSVR
jgi:hypothetical protein